MLLANVQMIMGSISEKNVRVSTYQIAYVSCWIMPTTILRSSLRNEHVLHDIAGQIALDTLQTLSKFHFLR